jgi:hypothetical protein
MKVERHGLEGCVDGENEAIGSGMVHLAKFW